MSESESNRDLAGFCSISLIARSESRTGGLRIGTDQAPPRKPICETVKYLEPVLCGVGATLARASLSGLFDEKRPLLARNGCAGLSPNVSVVGGQPAMPA